MIGETIGHYRVVEQLGSGGMGVVYRARDLRLERDVAIKVIRPERWTPGLEAAFLREARTVSSLNHPGIITIYDILTHRSVGCIVMELAVGQPLNQVIPSGGFAAERVVELGTRIGEALAAAHAAGVVHRDLKPANILVLESGAIKLLDFGVAKLQKTTTAADNATETMSLFAGKAVGTIAYMAPEQARAETVDERADIFSFGVILSHMATGALPFRGANPVALLRAIQVDEPEPIRAVRPEAPGRLEALILRALAREREARFASMDELLAELRGCLTQVETGGEAPARPMTARPQDQQGDAPQPPSTGSERASIAVLPFHSLSADRDDVYLAAGLAAEVIHALTGVPRLRVAPQQASFRLGEAEPRAAAKVLNTRYVVGGTLRRAGERLRVQAELIDSFEEMVVWSKTYDRRLTDIFEMQEEISKAIVSSIGGHMVRADTDAVYRIPTENLDAWGLVRKAYHIWNYEFTPEGVADSVAMLRRAVELDPQYAVAWAHLGHTLFQMLGYGKVSDPAAVAKEGLAAADRAFALAPNDPDVLQVVSLVFLQTWQYEKAVHCARRAIRLAPFDLIAWGRVALAHVCAGGSAELEEAEQILRKITADAPDHPSAPYWYQFLTAGLLRMQRYAEAVEAGERAVAMQPTYASSQVLLAEAYCRTGRPDDARRILDILPQYVPGFTVERYQKYILPMCRSQEIVDSLCGQAHALQLAQAARS